MNQRKITSLPHNNFPIADGNWDTNRSYPITTIVIHTEVGTKEGTRATFNNPASKVSAHYAVNLDGTLDHFIDEDMVAYQAGNYKINQCSIGIEHEDGGKPNDPRTDALYLTSQALVADLCTFYGLPCDRIHVVKHSEVSQLGTSCPDSLDIDRIVSGALTIMNKPPVPPPPPPTPPASVSVLSTVYEMLVNKATKWDNVCQFYGFSDDDIANNRVTFETIKEFILRGHSSTTTLPPVVPSPSVPATEPTNVPNLPSTEPTTVPSVTNTPSGPSNTTIQGTNIFNRFINWFVKVVIGI